MFCPNCGRENLAGKKFCPSCGLKLQAIQQALSQEQGEFPAAVPMPKAPGSFPPNGLRFLTSGFFVMMLGVIVGILGKNTLANKTIADIGAILAVLGIGLIGYFGITMMGAGINRSAKPRSLPTNHQTKELPPTIEPESITEHTTRQLDLKLRHDENRRPSQELFQP